MKLRFNFNSVVQFSIRGFSTPHHISGRVIEVFDDEVVIVPQCKLKPKQNHSLEEDFVSIDSGEPVHVQRDLIYLWRYLNIDELDDSSILDNICKGATTCQFDTDTGLYTGITNNPVET